MNNPNDPNIVTTSQTMAGPPQNMGGNIATLPLRVGAPQVVGARPAAPGGLTLQMLQGIQTGQQGHLLLKTESGYQLLRLGSASGGNMPPTSVLTAPTLAIRPSTVPALPGIVTMSTSVASVAPMQSQMQTAVVVTGGSQSTPQTAVTTQRPLDNTKEKCRNFLANLLDLSSKESKTVETNVRNLIQELIDAQVEPEEFCGRLERLLNASPQPCLIGFLKKSLPLLRQSLVNKELFIEGINPPSSNLALSGITTQPIMTSGNFMQKTIIAQKPILTGTKPGITILQNIPFQGPKLNINKVAAKGPLLTNKSHLSRPSTATLNTVLTLDKKSNQFSQQFGYDKNMGVDDINDVATMGGVNLAEESQKILGSTELIGTQIRSCKDECLVPINLVHARLNAAAAKFGLEDSDTETATLISRALCERLKTIIEKLAVIAQHRMDLSLKSHPLYEVSQDIKGQLKFLEDLDRVDMKKKDESERELLLRAAKSRSKNEDPEQAKLKAKAKEMQRAELEELRQREANLTALQAIGSRKKPRFDGPGGMTDSIPTKGGAQSGQSFPSSGQLALRSRLIRVTLRDATFFMEQEKETRHSTMLYKNYLK